MMMSDGSIMSSGCNDKNDIPKPVTVYAVVGNYEDTRILFVTDDKSSVYGFIDVYKKIGDNKNVDLHVVESPYVLKSNLNCTFKNTLKYIKEKYPDTIVHNGVTYKVEKLSGSYLSFVDECKKYWSKLLGYSMEKFLCENKLEKL